MAKQYFKHYRGIEQEIIFKNKQANNQGKIRQNPETIFKF